LDFLRESILEPIAFQLQLVGGLEIEPEALGRSKEPRQAQCRVRRDGPLIEHDLVDPARRNSQVLGQTVLGQLKGLQEILQQDLPRMYWCQSASAHRALLVIIRDLDIEGVPQPGAVTEATSIGPGWESP
jgi:hypothetical protein